jgi:hypothetical protein
MLIFAAMVLVSATSDAAAQGRSPAQPEICEKEAPRLTGLRPIRVGADVKQPKRIRYVAPKYPALPPGTVGSGVWLGEYLIGTKGEVVQVWPLRELRFTPPFPQFNQAIVDSLKQWVYEPISIDGRATPVCATMSVNINWS